MFLLLKDIIQDRNIYKYKISLLLMENVMVATFRINSELWKDFKVDCIKKDTKLKYTLEKIIKGYLRK